MQFLWSVRKERLIIVIERVILKKLAVSFFHSSHSLIFLLEFLFAEASLSSPLPHAYFGSTFWTLGFILL